MKNLRKPPSVHTNFVRFVDISLSNKSAVYWSTHQPIQVWDLWNCKGCQMHLTIILEKVIRFLFSKRIFNLIKYLWYQGYLMSCRWDKRIYSSWQTGSHEKFTARNARSAFCKWLLLDLPLQHLQCEADHHPCFYSGNKQIVFIDYFHHRNSIANMWMSSFISSSLVRGMLHVHSATHSINHLVLYWHAVMTIHQKLIPIPRETIHTAPLTTCARIIVDYVQWFFFVFSRCATFYFFRSMLGSAKRC